MSVEEVKIINQSPILSDQIRLVMDSAVSEYAAELEAEMELVENQKVAWIDELTQITEAVADNQQDVFLPTSPDLESEIANQVHLEDLEANVGWSDQVFPVYIPNLVPPPIVPLPFVQVDQRFLKYNTTHTMFTPPFDNSHWRQGIGGSNYTVPDKQKLEEGKLGSVGPIKASYPLNAILVTSVCSYLNTVDNLVEMDIRFHFYTKHDITIVTKERCSTILEVSLASTIFNAENTTSKMEVKRVFYDEILSGNKIWRFKKPEQTFTLTINLKVPNIIKPSGYFVLNSELVQQLLPHSCGSGSLWTPVNLTSIDVFQFSKP